MAKKLQMHFMYFYQFNLVSITFAVSNRPSIKLIVNLLIEKKSKVQIPGLPYNLLRLKTSILDVHYMQVDIKEIEHYINPNF